MGKNTLERILYIDEMIRNGRHPKKKDIAQHFEVSLKTIERDIDYMRDRLAAPIMFDRQVNGYRYSLEGYFLPALHMRQEEALALFISHYLGNAWRGTPLASAANSIWERISGFMEEDILIDTSAFNETVFLVDQSVEFDTSIWIGVYTATRNRHKVTIAYKTPQFDVSFQRIIHPYRLIHHRNSWYCLAFDEYRNRPLIFSRARIDSLVESPERYELPNDFRIED